MPVINTRQSMVSQLQTPTLSRQGVPVSFVNQDDEPHVDTPPPAPRMPDQPPAYLDPAPDAPEEDEDDRPCDPADGLPLDNDNEQIELALMEFRNAYMRISNLLSERKARRG